MTRPYKARTAHPGRWKLLLAGAITGMAAGVWLMVVSAVAGLAVYIASGAAMTAWVAHDAATRSRCRYRPRHTHER